MANALARKPALLLLDEVVAGLTPAETEEMITLIRRIGDGRVTIIMVEHIMRVIMGLSDRVVVRNMLENDRIVSAGPGARRSETPEVRRAYLGV